MDDKIYNILFVEAGFGYGGSSIFLYYLLKNLNRQKFNPRIIFYHNSLGPDARRISGLGIEVYELNKTGAMSKIGESRFSNMLSNLLVDFTLALKIKRIIREKRIHLLVFNNDFHYHLPALLASLISRTPCICRKAGIGGGRIIKRLFGRFVNLYYVISLATLKDFLSENLTPKRMMPVIYEGIDLNEFDPSLNGGGIRKTLNIPITAPVVGSISRLSKTKGQVELIEVARRVLKEEPETMFLIVGSDFDREDHILDELTSEAGARGLRDNIHFLGWRDDIQEILAAINIFIQNSLYPEGLGISCLEAMAMGKPTVVTEMGGLSETTIDGLTGFILPANKPERMAEAILRLIRDRNLQRRMGENARKFAEARFNITKGTSYIEQIYLQVIERNSSERYFHKRSSTQFLT